ncbi:hypothetical protein PR048_018710 [Dryococelus australis]|uniref:Secreted protein n=1 Tax=Dryococelus australis TaxID=614101 RepID=A0ABQ9HD23_9NEOP|nr:hypothetical protein PR048_018710 [Dryococelus australis]
MLQRAVVLNAVLLVVQPLEQVMLLGRVLANGHHNICDAVVGRGLPEDFLHGLHVAFGLTIKPLSAQSRRDLAIRDEEITLCRAEDSCVTRRSRAPGCGRPSCFASVLLRSALTVFRLTLGEEHCGWRSHSKLPGADWLPNTLLVSDNVLLASVAGDRTVSYQALTGFPTRCWSVTSCCWRVWLEIAHKLPGADWLPNTLLVSDIVLLASVAGDRTVSYQALTGFPTRCWSVTSCCWRVWLEIAQAAQISSLIRSLQPRRHSVTGLQHVGTPFANQHLAIYQPSGSPVNQRLALYQLSGSPAKLRLALDQPSGSPAIQRLALYQPAGNPANTEFSAAHSRESDTMIALELRVSALHFTSSALELHMTHLARVTRRRDLCCDARISCRSACVVLREDVVFDWHWSPELLARVFLVALAGNRDGLDTSVGGEEICQQHWQKFL